jgi:outer membrane protein assembly factor BamB
MDIGGATLLIGGTEHELGNRIAEHIEFEDFVVVLLDLTGDYHPELGRNVIAVNKDGSVRWRIEKAPVETDPDSYAGIFDDDGDLRAYNLCGMYYRVDRDTGEVSDGRFVK